MKNNTFLLLLISFSTIGYTQDQRTTIYGDVKSDIKQLENIHVINKNTNKGTITDTKGIFQVAVKENDTLIFSGIQFYYLEIAIDKQNITNKTITVDLLQKINVLDEITVKHNLTGNILIDAGKIKNSISKVKDGVLDFNNIDYRLVGNISDEFSRSRTSNDSQILPNANGNLIGLVSMLLKPLAKPISKIGATKRNLKKMERIYQGKITSAPEKIRIESGDAFFTETLNIPKEHIKDFIEYYLPKGIANLYVDNKKIELIELLLVKSKAYNYEIKNEK